MFLNGQGRYGILWETMNRESSDVIAEGFGPISGISRRSIEDVIRSPTLSGNKRINGRQLMSKAKVALREAKVLLGFWSEFTRNGMPSGMDESDALKHVLNRAFQEKSAECDDNDDDDDDEEIEETCGEEVEDEGIHGDEMEPTRSPTFYPAALLLFMLYGPYGVAVYGLEVSPAFTMDTDGIDELTKNVKMNTNSIKEEHKKDNDRAR